MGRGVVRRSIQILEASVQRTAQCLYLVWASTRPRPCTYLRYFEGGTIVLALQLACVALNPDPSLATLNTTYAQLSTSAPSKLATLTYQILAHYKIQILETQKYMHRCVNCLFLLDLPQRFGCHNPPTIV